MNKKAKELSEWYAKLAENDNGWTLSGGVPGCFGPRMDSVLSRHIVNPPRSVKKIIDLSVCIKSGIDMEVSKSKVDYWKVTQLTGIRVDDVNLKYISHLHNFYPYCRVRQDHWHPWHGEDCPLPEGLVIGYSVLGGTRRWINNKSDYLNLDWSVIYEFIVYGVIYGYRYEWMEE